MAIPDGGVFLGRAGTGSAYVLGSNLPSALAIYEQGQRARALAEQRVAAERIKRDQLNAKDYNDTVTFKQDGSPYFSGALEQQVYAPLTGKLTSAFQAHPDDAITRGALTRPMLQKANNETVQSEAKTKYLHDTIGAWQQDKNLIDTEYAGRHLSAALHPQGADGQDRQLLPSEMDVEKWKSGIQGDEKLYKEPEVVARAAKNLFPVVTQKIADAGVYGGQHQSDMVKAKMVAFDGRGRPRLNGDGTPVLNLGADTQQLLEHDPLFKLKVDAREAAYNQQRDANPALPPMTRRGHMAQMLGPLAYYDATHDEGLNAQVHQPKSAAGGKPKGYDIVPDDGSFGDYTHQAFVSAGKDWNTAKPLYPGGVPIHPATKYEQGIQTLGGGNKPVTNSGKEVGSVGTPFTRIGRADEKGHFIWTANNKPIAGTYQNHFLGAADLKTGDLIEGKTKAEQAQLVREGKARMGMYVNYSSTGNKDYSALHDEALAALKKTNGQKPSEQQKAPPVLEAEARKIALQGSETITVPYDKENHLLIDSDTHGYYRTAHQHRLQMAQQLRSSPAPSDAQKNRPTFLKTKTGPVQSTTPTNANTPNKSGGMID